MERYTVDRIEDGVVILEKEDLTHIELPAADFDFNINEGNVLLFENGIFTIDKAHENEMRRRIFSKQKNIFKNK